MNLTLSNGCHNVLTLSDCSRIRHTTLTTTDLQAVDILESLIRHGEIEIRTSGSTGNPTPIKLAQPLLEWSVIQTTQHLQLEKEKVFLCLPADKIGGCMMLVRSWINKWPITVVEPSRDPMEALPLSHDFSFMSLVPYQLMNILSNHESIQKLSRFKNVLIGGASLSKKLVDKINDLYSALGTRFFSTYGMTETASHIALQRVDADFNKYGYTLFEGIHTELDTEDCLMIEILEVGLRIQTNDRCALYNGKLTFLGRRDGVVNSGAIKINIQQLTERLEGILSAEDIAAETYVLWKEESDVWGEMLILIAREHVSMDALKQLINNELEPELRPKKYYSIKDFVMTSSGKIDVLKSFQKSVEVGS